MSGRIGPSSETSPPRRSGNTQTHKQGDVESPTPKEATEKRETIRLSKSIAFCEISFGFHCQPPNDCSHSMRFNARQMVVGRAATTVKTS